MGTKKENPALSRRGGSVDAGGTEGSNDAVAEARETIPVRAVWSFHRESEGAAVERAIERVN
jgi:hypothetical protein